MAKKQASYFINGYKESQNINLIKEKFEKIGVGVLSIETRRSIFGEYKCSIVETSPVNLNLIWGRRLGIPDCSIIAFDP